MRKEDCLLNASQILTLTNKNPSDIEHLLQLMEQSIKVEVLPPIVGIAPSCSWVNFEHGQILCKHFGLEQELQPLIDYGFKIQGNGDSKPYPKKVQHRPKCPHGYIHTHFLLATVSILRN